MTDRTRDTSPREHVVSAVKQALWEHREEDFPVPERMPRDEYECCAEVVYDTVLDALAEWHDDDEADQHDQHLRVPAADGGAP